MENYRYKIDFSFEYGAGGCLWAGEEKTRDEIGFDILDATLYDLNGNVMGEPKISLSQKTIELRDLIDKQHSTYLNPEYQILPSLWTQSECDNFNSKVDELFALLMEELGINYELIDKQQRYSEDENLKEYLINPEKFYPKETHILDKKNDEKKYIPFLIGILVEVVLLVICIFFMGGGHGTYIPTKMFFPYTMLSTIGDESMSAFFIIIALIQYPIYGLIIQYAKSEKAKSIRFSAIIVIHLIAMILAFVLKNDNFN